MKPRFVPVSLLALVLGAVVVAACGSDESADASSSSSGGDAGPVTCKAGEKVCDAKCVSLDDPAFGCAAQACTPCASAGGANTTSSCAAGKCTTTCAAGYTECDGNLTNGCEVHTDADVAHCGSCTNVCGTAHTTSRTCDKGKCVLACEPGFVKCGADADGCDTDVRSDPNNCGGCGRDCLGAACANSKCAVIDVATGESNPVSIDVGSPNVFFTNADKGGTPGNVRRVPKTGGPAVTVIAAAGASNPNSVVATGVYIFTAELSTTNPNLLLKRADAPNGGPTEDLGPTFGTAPGFLYLGPKRLWWSNLYGDTRIYRAASDGSNPEPVVIGTGEPTGGFANRSGGVTADGTYVYWADTLRGKVYRLAATGSCDQDTPASCPELASASQPYAIAQDSHSVYWTELGSQKIQKLAKVSPIGTAPTTIATNQANAVSIASDGVHLYWCNQVEGTIRHARADATTACNASTCEVLHTVATPSQVAVDDKAVYWAAQSGVVQKIGKYR